MVKIKGNIILIVRDRSGREKHIVEKDIITDIGKAHVAGLINGIETIAFTYIAIGTGTAAETPGDIALETEIARKEATCTRETTNVPDDTARLEATFSSADGLTGTDYVSESGVFDSSTGGDMLCRQTFTEITVNWDAGDTLTIIWKIVVS